MTEPSVVYDAEVEAWTHPLAGGKVWLRRALAEADLERRRAEAIEPEGGET